MTLLDGELHPIERQLLDELGGADPAESQADTLAAWSKMVEEATELMRVRPAEGEWSAMEVLAHMAATELMNGLRFRAILVEDVPVLSDYDASAWMPLLRRKDVSATALLALFTTMRRANLDFWTRLDATGRARSAIHPKYGPETVELRFNMLAGHDRTHLAQAERAVETARLRR